MHVVVVDMITIGDCYHIDGNNICFLYNSKHYMELNCTNRSWYVLVRRIQIELDDVVDKLGHVHYDVHI